MTAPLRPGRPGRSQFSHGKGMMAHPDSNYHRAELPFPEASDKHDATNRRRAEFRSDPTNAAESIIPDMYEAEGNPDLFGPQPKMVQEAAQIPPARFPQPNSRDRVQRQG
ncbi:hypothetical protein HWB99_gp001 [Mycobacterium phage DrLupo]|uniref:Uncharacterized protein n=1 Tax=Mycobacterium phage DrLupo TaxID=2499037 RepID=A0A3S9UQG2_9CAUD|nr:hypothetical protein HWB99_gp001 [Mycobacterium phage DrLupo]AZS12537.1 hypothetical protein SEA_DRLUPO_1 [Mycobacterium phage DrLupo]